MTSVQGVDPAAAPVGPMAPVPAAWDRLAWAGGLGLLGTAVGLVGAARPSIWYDEAATLSAIRRSPGEIVQLAANVDAVHGLYYLTARAWALVFGDGIVAIRALSAVGAGVTVGLVFVLVDRLVGRRAAIWSGVVAAVLPGLSWAGLEGRSYSWSAAWATLATYLLVRAREDDRLGRWSAYAAVLTVMCWWSLFAALMLLVHGVALVVTERRLRRAWVVAAGAAAAATVPLLVLVAVGQSGQLSWIQETRVAVLRTAVLRQVWIGQTRNVVGAHGYELVALGLGVVVGVLSLRWALDSRSGRDPVAVPLVVAWATLPTLVLVSGAMLGFQVYSARYLTFSAPAFAVAAGAGLALTGLRSRLLLVGLVLALAMPVLAAHRAEDAKSGDDYRRLARVAREAGADVVVFGRRDMRGIRIAYPSQFRGVRDVSVARGPRATATLWGTNLRPRRLARHELAGRTVVLYRVEPASGPGAFGRRLGHLGCRPVAGGARTTRATATVLRC